MKILNSSLACELHEVELDLENVMVVCEIKFSIDKMDSKNYRNRILGKRTDDVLSFFARFRMFEKASKFCGHVCRLDLRLWA